MPHRPISNYRILLFGESATAVSAAACLRGSAITVIAAPDEPRFASSSRFVENRILLPERSPSAVLQALKEIRSRSSETLLIFPCSDAWIDALSQDLSGVLEYAQLLPATAEHCALTLDKIRFADMVTKIGLPQPIVYQSHVSPEWIPPVYPFVLKPYSTYRYEDTHGVKAMVIRNSGEWRLVDKQMLDDIRFMAQEYIAGASLSVCFCSTTDGRLAGAYATEKIHYGVMMTGSRVATVNRPDAIHLASEFVRLSGFIGYGELELIDSERGPVLLELNARPWSQVVMSDALKVPLLKMAIDLMMQPDHQVSPKFTEEPLEWLAWDADLLHRRMLRRTGKPIRPDTTSQRIYAQSFLRDPLPALIHALNYSRLRPRRLVSVLAAAAQKLPFSKVELRLPLVAPERPLAETKAQ